jgi:GNAT superfamily N-acetyltransferase
VQVRPADLNDVDDLAQLRAAWREQSGTDEFVATFREWFLQEQTSRWWWIASDDRDAIGMINVKLFDRMPSPQRAPSRWGYLANLFVTAAHRGEGVGADLVGAAINRARAEGLVRLALSPSELSVPLYGRATASGRPTTYCSCPSRTTYRCRSSAPKSATQAAD